MGHGISFHFEAKPRGLLRRRRSSRALVSELAGALHDRAVAAFPEFARLARRHELESGSVLLALHPSAEEVRVELEGEHGVHLTARTNVPGPGWHAFLVEHLEAAARELELDLRPGTEEDPIDETSFHARRDFAALQEEHAAWLRGVCRIVRDRELRSPLISMPIGTPMPESPGLVAPMGVFPLEWAHGLCDAPLEAMRSACEEFFPWWDAGVTPRTKLGLARVLLFDLAWHPPLDDAERARMKLVCELLRALAPTTRFGPDTATTLIAEVETLLASKPAQLCPPRAGGFGLRRAVLDHPLFSSVSARFPAWAYQRSEDEGATAHAWWGNVSLHVSSYSFTAERMGPLLALPDTKAAEAESKARRVFRLDVPEGRGSGWIASERDANGISVAVMLIAVPGELVQATLAFGPELDDDGAEALLRAVRVGARKE